MTLRAILFDLDGTLIDQFQAIYKAFSQVISDMGFPVPDFATVKKSVGGASESTMSKLIGKEYSKEAVRRLRPIFEKEMLNGLHPLPGALDILNFCEMNNIKTAVLTNKYGPHARAACTHLNFIPPLKFVLGANDTVYKKPEIPLTQIALDRIGYSKNETIYVGDSPYDIKTANNIGMRSFVVPTGTHTMQELLQEQPTALEANLTDLIENQIKTLV